MEPLLGSDFNEIGALYHLIIKRKKKRILILFTLNWNALELNLVMFCLFLCKSGIFLKTVNELVYMKGVLITYGNSLASAYAIRSYNI